MAAADTAPQGSQTPPSWRDQAQSPAFVLGVMAAAVGAGARAWIADGSRPLSWNDSADYLETAETPLVSLERLAGQRPILTPLLLSATEQDLPAFVDWQILIAALAWGILAGVVAHQIGPLWGKCVGAGLVLSLSLTWRVSMWDQQILTESTALSALALFVAGGLWFWSRPGPLPAVALVSSATLWLVARDSHLVPVAAIGAALVIAAIWAPAPRRRIVALTGVYLIALAFLIASMSSYGHRGDQPLEHVYAVRVLPFSDRVEWFSNQGMPDGAALAAIPEAVDEEHDQAPYTPVPPDPRWDEWRAWLSSGGRSALVRYVATHPAYLYEEPTAKPERVFNNLGGIEGYRPLELRTIPGLGSIFHPSTAVTLIVAAGSIAVFALRRLRPDPLFWVGLALVLSAGPHALVVWHGDGMEASRHLLITGVQLRLGTLLLVLAAAVGGQTARGTAPSRLVR